MGWPGRGSGSNRCRACLGSKSDPVASNSHPDRGSSGRGPSIRAIWLPVRVLLSPVRFDGIYATLPPTRSQAISPSFSLRLEIWRQLEPTTLGVSIEASRRRSHPPCHSDREVRRSLIRSTLLISTEGSGEAWFPPPLSSRPKGQAKPGPKWRDLGADGREGEPSAEGRAGGRSQGNGARFSTLDRRRAPRLHPGPARSRTPTARAPPRLRRPLQTTPGPLVARMPGALRQTPHSWRKVMRNGSKRSECVWLAR